jgi:hypothetical protein
MPGVHLVVPSSAQLLMPAFYLSQALSQIGEAFCQRRNQVPVALGDKARIKVFEILERGFVRAQESPRHWLNAAMMGNEYLRIQCSI